MRQERLRFTKLHEKINNSETEVCNEREKLSSNPAWSKSVGGKQASPLFSIQNYAPLFESPLLSCSKENNNKWKVNSK